MPTKFGMIWTYSDKVMLRQGNPDSDDDDATADKSNPYMSPFQATQKWTDYHIIETFQL